MGGETVEVLVQYRDDEATEAEIYALEFPPESGSEAIKDNPMTPDESGRVSGWLEDGRYKAVISSTEEDFSTIEQDFDVRSGGEFKIANNGVPTSPESPQIFFDDSDTGNPAIKLGSGETPPDVVIQRGGSNELVFDSSISGQLSTVVKGNLTLAGVDKALSVNGARIQNTATPLVPSDAVNKSYVDATNVNVESFSYGGKIHNMPLFTPTGGLTELTEGEVKFSLLNVPLGVSVSSIEFIREDAGNTLTFQFGIFAEYNDFDSIRKMVCLASTNVETTGWATGAKDLSLGFYNEEGQFVPENFFYGEWILEASFTGNLYAGIATTGTNADVSLLGLEASTPVVDTDLGLTAVEQLPYFAGTSAPDPAITIESPDSTNTDAPRYKGSDVEFQIAGTLDNVEELPEFGTIGEAYIVEQSLYVRSADLENSWKEKSTVIDFPDNRSEEIPFVRVRI